MPITAVEGLSPLELERVLTIPEVMKFTSLSEDTLERRYARWIIQLSPRRRGMKLKHVLSIASGHAQASEGKGEDDAN